MSALVVLEVCLELLKLGYPVDLLRALTHSLPKWPSAILARQVVRSFQICLVSLGLSTMEQGDGSASGPGRPKPTEGSFTPCQVEQLTDIITALFPTSVTGLSGPSVAEDGTPSLPPTYAAAKEKNLLLRAL